MGYFEEDVGPITGVNSVPTSLHGIGGVGGGGGGGIGGGGLGPYRTMAEMNP